MDNNELSARLDAVCQQGYPLMLTSEDAEALVECIDRIMSAVPEDDRIFVRGDYALATSALYHPDISSFSGQPPELPASEAAISTAEKACILATVSQKVREMLAEQVDKLLDEEEAELRASLCTEEVLVLDDLRPKLRALLLGETT